MTNQINIFLVDDHPMVCEGLAHLLQTAGFTIAGQAESIGKALAHPALQTSHLVLLDLSLGRENGIELLKRLRKLELPVLVYSMHDGSNIIRQALDAGAGGYVTKREASGSLLEAIRSVLQGTRYLSPRAERALQQSMPTAELTGQQQQIYQLMGRGLSNHDIAEQLNISVRTLESYCVRIMDKMSVSGMKELRRRAITDGQRRLT